MWGSREGSACSQGLSRVACLVVQLLLFSHLAPQGSDNIWKLPGGPLMVARVSPLPSTLWDRGLACRGSCPRVVLGLVPRGPAAKEGMIRSCLHSVHTPAPTPWALGLSVPEAALTCSLRLALPSWRGLSPCGWSQNVMDCCALAMFLLRVGVCPAWSHVGATVGPPTPHRPGLVLLGAHTQLHLVLGGAGPGLHPKCMWGCVTWGDSSYASDTFSHLKITLQSGAKGVKPSHPYPRPLRPSPGGGSAFRVGGCCHCCCCDCPPEDVMWGSGCSQAGMWSHTVG